MTVLGRTQCQPQTNDRMGKRCNWIVSNSKHIRNNFLDDSEENDFSKHIHTVSTHEEMDGSSSCTLSTPFLSPSTVWGWEHWLDLDIWQLVLLHTLQVNSLFGLCGSEVTRNRLPVFTKGQIFDPVCFCYFVATFQWVKFLWHLLSTIPLFLWFLEPMSLWV